MDCQYELIEPRGDKFLHRCIRCERDKLSRRSDPTELHTQNCPGEPLIGDKIERFLHGFGIRECAGCGKRKRAANKWDKTYQRIRKLVAIKRR